MQMHHEQRQARPGYLLLKIAWLKQKSDATFFKKMIMKELPPLVS